MINVATVQFAPLLGKPFETRQILKELLDSLQPVDLVVLPELANSGYNFSSRDQAVELSEEISNSPFLKMLKEQAKKMNCSIVTGLCERMNAKLFNSSIYLDGDGIKGHYRKLHLFMNEKKIFEPGNFGLPVFDFKQYKIGMMVCFDYMFPEVCRTLALKEADIICHPSNLVTNFAQKVLPALGLMNSVYILTANRIGVEGDTKFNGRSMMVDPRGHVFSTSSSDQVEIRYSSIMPERSRDKWVTSRNHVFLDRRLDVYPNLIDQ